jgi:hypothetical protein
MSTPYESLAQLAQERVGRLTVEAHEARLVAEIGALAEAEPPTPLTGELPARRVAIPGGVQIRRLLPIRLP